MRRSLTAPLLLLFLLAGAARAEAPAQRCARVGDDDRTQPIPPSLVAGAAEALQLRTMPPAQIERSTVYRCTGGRVLVCNSGADLPCGKADTDRHLPAAIRWCRAHPDTAFIPAYAVSNATAFRWRCASGVAIPGSPAAIDGRGFFARYWAAVR